MWIGAIKARANRVRNRLAFKRHTKMDIKIDKMWNGAPIFESDAVYIHLNFCRETKTMDVEIKAPFYHDAPPKADRGSLMGLWDYEVVELFLLGECEEYLELEFGPHNHYLALLLRGKHNVLKHSLPFEYTSTINGNRWTAAASIPLSYLPKNVHKFNAYAIHGSSENRTYLSLFPTPHGEFEEPDFHRLEYFADFPLKHCCSQN